MNSLTPFLPHINKIFSSTPQEVSNIIQKIKCGDSTCYIDSTDTIAVYSPVFRDGEFGLFVEFGYSKSLSFDGGIDFFEKMASVVDAKFIEFRSDRKAMKRVAMKLGFVARGENEGYTIWIKGL